MFPHFVSCSPLVPGTHNSLFLRFIFQVSHHSLFLEAQDASFAPMCTGFLVAIWTLMSQASYSEMPATFSNNTWTRMLACFANLASRLFTLAHL